MTKKLTPWFPGDVKPARKGVYERDFPNGSLYSRWNGRHWIFGYYAVEHAATRVGKSLYQTKRWRGLSSNPKAKK